MRSYVCYSMLSMSGAYGLHYYDIDVANSLAVVGSPHFMDLEGKELMEIKTSMPKGRTSYLLASWFKWIGKF